ncbi:trypsin-like serine protease [Vibrio europaeus]|uniref:Serine protease n=1 Tax=Vibrio europaeus TaxID=300876 RepID=A0A178J7T6_9VIBR|nr:trypsin-like serine protease [Vibrio europaeus]MDC5705261.1 trypsin-like serine protease [Vibrio europaeus]MDC5710540.1 trypsin-like serine protease [Vibrio europaeus]MDC5715630.1 trypsin-like serine protease [Vibrio europaeus]MDC5719791.1 trypsin-like serine protease [Vibrio europaeus]MDC5724321.1 trypsin-like serine protease [Vibrio europaeus]
MKASIRLICLLLLTKLSYAVEVTPYIVNGSDANIVNYPSFASLFFRNGNLYSSSSYCGATMINSQFVLTAAHCIYDDDNLMLYTVVAPQLDDESNFLSSQQAKALEFYYPDTYIDSSAELWPDDIAIIKLETPLAVSNYTSLINTTINNTFSVSDIFKAIGHGLIEGNVSGGTNLLETTLTYMTTSACQAEYGSKLTSSHLCFSGAISGGYRNSTCNGDSGGPVYWYNGSQYIQIGITSFGPSTCGDTSRNVTSVFTDVHDYQAWISRVINGLETPKAYVATVNGVRTLVKGSSSPAVTTTSGDSGGGSANPLVLLYLLLVLLGRFRPIFTMRISNLHASHK